jgi:hypothetical protein
MLHSPDSEIALQALFTSKQVVARGPILVVSVGAVLNTELTYSFSDNVLDEVGINVTSSSNTLDCEGIGLVVWRLMLSIAEGAGLDKSGARLGDSVGFSNESNDGDEEGIMITDSELSDEDGAGLGPNVGFGDKVTAGIMVGTELPLTLGCIDSSVDILLFIIGASVACLVSSSTTYETSITVGSTSRMLPSSIALINKDS